MKVALFLADPDTRINQQIALGLAEELQKHGPWTIRLRMDMETLRELREVVRANRPDALVMHSSGFDAHMTRFIARLGIPLVCVPVDWQPTLPAPVVIPDDEAIGLMAAKHLLELGFEHFATLKYEVTAAGGRISTFSREVTHAQKTLDSIVLPLLDPVDRAFHAIRGEAQLVHRLRRLPKPCAVFAHSDNLGAQLIEICVRHGLRIPEDIAVLGVDDDPLFCNTVFPNLASVHVPNARIGVETARLILDWRPGRRVVKIPPTGVKERDSVRLRMSPDPLVSMALDHLRASAGKVVRVRDLQALTGLSPQMLVYRFRAATNRTPMEEVLRHRITHAQHLLGGSDEPASAIARQCGFKSVNRFYLTFRNLVGMSPLDYRRQFSA